MSYSGPGSVVNLVDEFLSHWAGVDGSQGSPLLVVPEGAAVTKSRTDLTALRALYFAVQSAPGSAPVAPPPAPQFPSVTFLRNKEENGHAALGIGRRLVVEALGAFNRKVRGSLSHTTFPHSLPALPMADDALADILRAADDMFDIWTSINAIVSPPPPPAPLFIQPLVLSLTAPGTNAPLFLDFTAAMLRLTNLKTADANILSAGNALSVMRPHRDNIWDRDIRPILVAYQKKVTGEFPAGHAFVTSLPRIYPAPGHTPAAVNATGQWNAATQKGDYAWSASTEATLQQYEVRQSPGPEYDSEASSVLAVILPGQPLTFATATGFETPGQTSSVKIYVVLTTGRERGSNTVTITRPL